MSVIQLDPVAVTAAPLLRAIAKGGWATRSELAEMAGRDRKNMARDLKTLANAGLATELDDETGIVLTDHARAQLDAIERAEIGEGKPGLPGGDRFPWQVGDIQLLRHAEICADPDNARRDWDSDEAKDELDALRQDIIQVGLLQNLVVRPGVATDGDGDPVYTLVGGERRWRAIGLAIFDDDWPADRPIPCRVVDLDELGHRLTALSENLQRRDLNPLEKAHAFDGLARALADQGVDESKINREIADRVGVTIEHIQQTRRFLDLPEADRERLALPDEDPRRLKVSEARKQLAEAAAAEKARAELLSIPVEERLAMVEVLHAITARAHYSYADIVVRAEAKDSEVGQALVGRGWVVFSGPLEYGDDTLGHYVVKRTGAVPSGLGAPLWSANEAERDDALRKVQSEAGHPDLTDYVTEWLNGPFEVTPEGQAIIQAAAEHKAKLAETQAANIAQREAAEAQKAEAREREALVVTRARDLFAAHRQTRPAPDAVTDLAQAADAPLPWRITHDNSVVAADGALVIGAGPSDRSEARMRLLVLALNALADLETPEDEAAPEDLPVELTEEEFVAAMISDLATHEVDADASQILAEFLADNGVAYGEDGWDWTAAGAHEVCMDAITAAMAGGADALFGGEPQEADAA